MCPHTLHEPITAALADGTPVVIRPIRPDDAPRLQAFHRRLSSDSIYLRWLSAHPTLSDREAAELTEIDYDRRMAFVATQPGNGGETLIGVARYSAANPATPTEAEAAIIVEDAFQHRRLGSLLLRRLLEYALAHGVRTWVGEVNAENTRMMKFVQAGGPAVQKRLEGGSWQIRVDLRRLPNS